MKKERLKIIFEYLKSKGLIHTKKDLAQKIKAESETISRAFSGSEKYLTDNLFLRINDAFGNIFIENWLLTGEGEMLKAQFQSDVKFVENQMFINVPHVMQSAHAGYLAGYGDAEFIETLPTYPVIVTDKSFKGNYRVFDVLGDCMDNGSSESIFDGDKVLGREFERHLWNGIDLYMRRWYFIIVHRTEGIIIRKITKFDSKKNTIECSPLNSIFNILEINLDEVFELYSVVSIVYRNARL